MGMFDYFHSSYNLGEMFTGVECQTKDFDDYGFGGSMSDYWLSPNGELYLIDIGGTREFMAIEKDDKDYKENLKFLNYKWVKTGSRGRVTPFWLTKYVEVYPGSWDGDWETWPTMQLHFKCGKLVEYQMVKRYENGKICLC